MIKLCTQTNSDRQQIKKNSSNSRLVSNLILKLYSQSTMKIMINFFFYATEIKLKTIDITFVLLHISKENINGCEIEGKSGFTGYRTSFMHVLYNALLSIMIVGFTSLF